MNVRLEWIRVKSPRPFAFGSRQKPQNFPFLPRDLESGGTLTHNTERKEVGARHN